VIPSTGPSVFDAPGFDKGGLGRESATVRDGNIRHEFGGVDTRPVPDDEAVVAATVGTAVVVLVGAAAMGVSIGSAVLTVAVASSTSVGTVVGAVGTEQA